MEENTKKKKRVRSPAYPMIDLKESIAKANTLWNKDRSNPVPMDAAYEHLGYRKKGGYGGRVIAALKQFDLIYEKHGDIILTQNAIDLALYKSTDQQYVDIVRKIALKPYSYNKLFTEYNGQLPSDATLRIKLIKEHGFNIDKVVDFISNFRSTIAFAGLSGLGKQEETIEEEVPKEEMISETPVFDTQRAKSSIFRGAKSFDIPLLEENSATITFQKFPLEKNDIDLLKKWFEVYAVALEKKHSHDEE